MRLVLTIGADPQSSDGMKIAGQKNDGAWFRLNKTLKTLRADVDTEAEIYDLSTRLASGEFFNNAFTAMQNMATQAGVTPPASPSSGSAWCARLVEIGIPRQLWHGRLSFTTYTRTGDAGSYSYSADYQSTFHALGKHIRKVCKIWLKTRRAIRDLTDTGLAAEGNPGGQPDATLGN